LDLAPSPDAGAASASREREGERLARLLRDEFDGVWRLIRRCGVPEASADDAAQEVFIVASRKLDQIEAGRERRYLYGIAIRVAANARRAHHSRPEQPDADALLGAICQLPLSDALLDQKRMHEFSEAVLAGMAHEHRTVFVLFELEGFSLREIAELLELPGGTVASRLRRAREIFQAAVARLKAANARQVP
jgi:RNA polymerase sigma-70 factor (ECF subfamily)